MSASLILVVLAALFVSWMIGANSVASTFGPVASSGAGGVLRGSLLAGVFGLLGALIQGGNVTGTVESGLLKGTEISAMTGGVILLSAALLVILGIFFKIPTPVAFTVVGGVLGAGIGLGADLATGQFQTIVATWVLIPFVAVPLGYVFSRILRSTVSRDDAGGNLGPLAFLIGAFFAFTAGANLVGLAIGPLVNSLDVSLFLLLGVGGAVILLGAWLGGPRIVSTVSRDYSQMDRRRSICALATAALIAQAATLLGIPVSFNEAIIASIIGSGLAVGTEEVQVKKIGMTALSWVGSFSASVGLAWLATVVFIA